jgi:hypothetical protein
MKRLLSPSPNGGLPYVNSDFNDILQSQHIKAYAGNLDSINDRPFSNSGTLDRGIILLGCIPYNATSISTTFDFTRSLIYLPKTLETGDFYEADPSIANSAYIVSNNLVYLTISETFESRIFRSGSNEQVLVKGYFTVTTIPPATPYIEFVNGKTKRNYKRVLKYALANTNDVMMTGNTDDFNLSTGLGVGDMYGFALCNGLNNTYDLTGRFVMGFKNGSATTPVDNTTVWDTTTSTQTYNSTDVMNYGAIGNKGGGRLDTGVYYPSKVLIIPELPAHNHTGTVDGNGAHQHIIAAGSGSANGSYLRNGEPGTGGQLSVDGGGSGGAHTHTVTIHNAGSFNAHEIRSPYLVLAYYQKITI